MKELKSTDETGDDFKNEIKACAKSASGTGHPHLVRLLATWRQNGSWYLLFPWANGNLREYWDDHQIPQRDASQAQWIAKQCWGIAQGLKKMHRSVTEEKLSPIRDWGIHGDLKPENILWFDDPKDKNGILVISDFGFTRFHGRDSRSIAAPAGNTSTYRAPEYDLTNPRKISRAYDMWTLGCLYLEFVTWYLTGPKGVADTFEGKRIKEDRGQCIPEDKFFNCFPHKPGAEVKPIVLKVNISIIAYCRTMTDLPNSGSNTFVASITVVSSFTSSWI